MWVRVGGIGRNSLIPGLVSGLVIGRSITTWPPQSVAVT